MRSLTIRAGPGARRLIRKHGLDPALIKIIAGASGGPKWLGLYRLDRAILETFADWFKERTDPLHMVGSSIGTWRLAAYATADPVAAFDRLWQAYSRYEWHPGQTPAQTLADSRALLDRMLGPEGAAQVLSHRFLRMHVVCAASKHLGRFNSRLALVPFFTAAGLANALSRKSLALFFDRAVFSDPRGLDLSGWDDFPPMVHPLTEASLHDALIRSCAIPLLLDGGPVGEIAGVFRDGGIIDYHFDVPFLAPDREGLLFYPHFEPRVVPGWFDKRLPWRRARPQVIDRMLLIAPDPQFARSLPLGKIPDRNDFRRLDNAERRRLWATSVAETERMADEFRELVENGGLIDRIEPLGAPA
ncbi:MAG: patatin-like phospholipase family protein [Rhodothalassiaceae bacterium]